MKVNLTIEVDDDFREALAYSLDDENCDTRLPGPKKRLATSGEVRREVRAQMDGIASNTISEVNKRKLYRELESK